MSGSTNPKDRIGAQKVPITNIPLVAILHESLALFDGELKYGYVNWAHETVAARIYADAAVRHIQKWLNGEKVDTDSLIHHLGHARACLAILLDAEQRGNLIDDRPPASDSPALLDEMKKEVVRLRKLRGKELNTTPTIPEQSYPQCEEDIRELREEYWNREIPAPIGGLELPKHLVVSPHDMAYFGGLPPAAHAALCEDELAGCPDPVDTENERPPDGVDTDLPLIRAPGVPDNFPDEYGDTFVPNPKYQRRHVGPDDEPF